MLQLAIAGNNQFSFSDVEFQRQGKSYSIDTVQSFLDSRDQNLELYFITGQDAFDAITTWRDWETLLSLCHFVVMTRPGYENGGLEKILPRELAAKYVYAEGREGFINPWGKGVFFRKTTFLDISASDIREGVQQSQSIQYLTPDDVSRYIASNSLYGSVKREA